MYCKNCKKHIRPTDYWYLFDNTEFTNRIAAVGRCPKCKQNVILLSETRKFDYKVFNQLEVGDKADYISSIVIKQIDYTQSDAKPIRKPIPYGWSFGKAIALLKDKCWKILRCDWFNNTETIGYIPFESSKIIDKEEYERVKR